MKLPVLSYSFLNNFLNCPKKAFHLYVAKDLPKQPETPELAYGNAVHTAMEKSIKSDSTVLVPPEWLKFVRPLLDRKRTDDVRAEDMLGMTKEGVTCTFFAPAVWLRGKADVVCLSSDRRTALFLDWKTGKVREDPHELWIQAVLLKAAVPPLQAIRGAYVWLKENRMGQPYDLSDTGPALAKVRATAEKISECMIKQDWEPTPNPLCGWCPVKSCEYNRSDEREDYAR